MSNENEAALIVRELVNAMVDNPSGVRVVGSLLNERSILVNVQVAESADAGKLIGKQGRTARALRTILGSIGGKMGMSITLNIHETKREDAQAA